MPQKKEADIKHPGRSHPILTAKEARERERQRQRDRRARQRAERAEASSRVIDPAPRVLNEEPNSMIILDIGGEREPTKKALKSKSRLLLSNPRLFPSNPRLLPSNPRLLPSKSPLANTRIDMELRTASRRTCRCSAAHRQYHT